MKSAIFLVTLCCLIGQLFAVRPIYTSYQTFRVTKLKETFGVRSYARVSLQFENFNQTRMHFNLDNEEEIIKSELIDVIQVQKSSCEDLENDTCKNDITNFIFQVYEINSDTIIPIRFLYTFNDDGRLLEETVNINLVQYIDELELKYLKNSVYEPIEGEQDLEIESDSVVKIKFTDKTDFDYGFYWDLQNEEDFYSKNIEYLGTYQENPCNKILPAPKKSFCPKTTFFRFRIHEINDSTELPDIIFIQKASPDAYIKQVHITLKLKECFKNGYKCCPRYYHTVYYSDNDGEWGIDNGNWCFITEKDRCSYTGYKCCSNSEVVYYDREGMWGVEDGDWCMFK